MSNIEVLLIVGGVSAGVGGVLFLLLPYLKKIGVNVEELIKKAETALKGADGVIQIAEQIIPGNKAVNALEVIDKFAKIGVDEAQQLYISSQLPASERKDTATNTVDAALKAIGINVTDELSTVINGVVESTVYASKSNDDVSKQEIATLKSNIIDLQKQLTTSQTTITQLQSANTQLTQKLTTVQNTVATAVK